MQPGSQEPENYSIDEMMERLKKAPAGKHEDGGELVTREDGSQVIRMRKRKRRSRQPQREREKNMQRRKFLKILALLVISVAAAALVAGAVIYSNSSPFRNALVQKIGKATGAGAEMTQFRMNPFGANANTLHLQWPDGFPIDSIQARGVHAKTSVGSLLGRSFRGDELLAAEATLTWRATTAGLQKPPVDPGTIRFKRIGVSRFHILPDDSMPRMFRLREAEASYYPNPGAGTNPQLRLNGGALQVHGLPKLRLDRALMEFRDEELQLSIARLLHGEDQSGELLLSGNLRPMDSTSTAILQIESLSFNIEGILGDRMARVIAARIDTTSVDGASSLTIPIGDPSASVLNLDFKSAINTPVLIRGFNFLSELAVLLEEPWFEQPYFESEVTGTIRWSNGMVEILNLQAEHRNRIAIRGNIRMEESGRLSGNIDIGLSPAMVASSPTRRLHTVISEASGGYRWISVEIGGAINAPTDNFMAILDNPPSRPTAPPPGGATGGTSFEELTRPR